MSIFVISDLHLSFGTNKPMEIFGWTNHIERLTANWNRLIKPEDTVVLPGDFSWALKTEEALEDFLFLESLPGKKVILKGNHDLWWSTVNKNTLFFEKHGIKSVTMLYNNAIPVEGFAVCGTRGWLMSGSADDKKIIAREAGRLERSLVSGEMLGLPLLVFMHYPPAYGTEVCTEFIDALKKHSVDKVFYGHIHGPGYNNAIPEYDGIKLKLTSCDCMNFVPFLIK